MALTIQQLRYLVAVADCRSITAAAAAVYVAQPALSRAVQSLERDLDVELVTRKGRGAELTSELLQRSSREGLVRCLTNGSAELGLVDLPGDQELSSHHLQEREVVLVSPPGSGLPEPLPLAWVASVLGGHGSLLWYRDMALRTFGSRAEVRSFRPALLRPVGIVHARTALSRPARSFLAHAQRTAPVREPSH
ncbi:helix-turn-helix domain-containing protein [Streptomyces sp. NPDC002446]